jgi:O-antigen/teichoic acid export membrane protein
MVITPNNLPPKQFFSRYFGLTAAKIALLVGKSVILILAYGWLPTADFALLAGILSVIEIVRPVSDLGAENIIYARLGNAQRLLPRVIQKILRLRLQVAGLISLIGIVGLIGFGYVNVAPLFLLPLIVAGQNTNLALLQKVHAYRNITVLTITAFSTSVASILIAYWSQADNLLLCLLLISPEVVAGFVGIYLSRTSWKSLWSSSLKNKKSIKKLLPYMLPSIGIGVIVMIYSRLDVIYIRPVLGEQAQADFSVAFRLVDPLFLILSLASLTLLAELGSNNSPDAKRISQTLFKKMRAKFYILFFGVFCILAFNLYYLSLYVFYFSSVAANLLIVFILTIPIKLLNTFYSSLLQRAGKFNQIFLAAMITLICTFTFAIPFGMVYGVMGVAVAAALAELINMLYQKKIVQKNLGDL